MESAVEQPTRTPASNKSNNYFFTIFIPTAYWISNKTPVNISEGKLPEAIWQCALATFYPNLYSLFSCFDAINDTIPHAQEGRRDCREDPPVGHPEPGWLSRLVLLRAARMDRR